MAQKLFYVDTSAADNFRKMQCFIGGTQVDFTDPLVRTLSIPLSGNIEYKVVVSQTPPSTGYTAVIDVTTQKVWLPITSGGDLDSKITFQTNPGGVDVTGKVFSIKSIEGTSEASPTENDWTSLSFNPDNLTILKLNGAVPVHIRFTLELNPFGGSDTQLDGITDYDGAVASSLDSQQWTFVDTLSGSDVEVAN